MARREEPDLVLCDVMVPELDGYGAVQALREDVRFAAMPFIFLTAKTDRSDVREVMNYGADDYLTKPVVRDDLLAVVTARLQRAWAVHECIEAAGSVFSPDCSSAATLQAVEVLSGGRRGK